MVTTSLFEPLTRQVAASFGLPAARVLVVPHPLGGIDEPAVLDRADAAVEPLLALFTG